MTAARGRRQCWAIVASAALAWTQACFPYRPPRPAGLAPGRDVRLWSDAPFGLIPDAPLGAPPPQTICRATRVEGRIRSATPAVVHFDTLRRVVPATKGDAACRLAGGAAVAIAPDEVAPHVTERRFSAGRTALLLGGIATVVVGGLAYIASTIEFDLSSGRGCASIC